MDVIYYVLFDFYCIYLSCKLGKVFQDTICILFKNIVLLLLIPSSLYTERSAVVLFSRLSYIYFQKLEYCFRMLLFLLPALFVLPILISCLKCCFILLTDFCHFSPLFGFSFSVARFIFF